MRGLANLAIIGACLSFIIALISRLTMKPVPLAPGGIDSQGLFILSNTFLLVAILLIVSGSCKEKK